MIKNIFNSWQFPLIVLIIFPITIIRFSKRIDEFIGSSEPHNWNIDMIIGNKKLKYGYYEKAISSYNKILKKNNLNSLGFFGKGMANFELENYDEAILNYSRSINLEPENSYYYVKRGAAFRKKKNYEMALKDFTFAIELEDLNNLKNFKSDYAFYFINSSIAKEKIKDFRGAYFDLKRAYYDAIK
tara:strand:+ start:684 stop:1241 length:558 start_codon:yes stop_codon:yes gene_type:complete